MSSHISPHPAARLPRSIYPKNSAQIGATANFKLVPYIKVGFWAGGQVYETTTASGSSFAYVKAVMEPYVELALHWSTNPYTLSYPSPIGRDSFLLTASNTGDKCPALVNLDAGVYAGLDQVRGTND